MVSYQLEPDQQELRETVARFAREVVAPVIGGYYERGEFPLVFATIHQLRDLAAFGSVQEALAFTETHHVPVRMPILERESGATRVYLPDDAGNSWNVPEHMTKSKEGS